MPGFLNNLGIALRERYSQTGSIRDLEESIRSHKQAINLAPLTYLDLPTYLTNLGLSLNDNYHRSASTNLERLPELGQLDLYQAYQTHLNQIMLLEKQAEVDIDRLRAVRNELDIAIGKIRRVVGYGDFLHLQANFEENVLAAMQSDIVLVYTAVTLVGGVALIVQPSGRVTKVWLDGLTYKALREKMRGPDDGSQVGGYRAAYESRRNDPSGWKHTIDDITGWLWQVLMGPVIDRLKSLPEADQIGNVILIPQGLLGMLPLHAAWTTDPTVPTGRRYALDEFLITYSPNARALKAARQRAAAILPEAIFAVDNPDRSLEFAEVEVTAALVYFPTEQRVRLN